MKVDWNGYYFPNEMMEQADAIENCMKQDRKSTRLNSSHVC